jgi:hypothetical protein
LLTKVICSHSRIQSCIQRYRGRRRINGDRAAYFNDYLFIGGIDSGAKAFSGNDPRELKEMTPAERRQATESAAVYGGSGPEDQFYNGDPNVWVVDFAGVAAGFFSISLGPLTGYEPPAVAAAIDVVENFLRYVLQHDVCPEYAADVQRALAVCDDARAEWPMVIRLQEGGPGLFSLAATKLFCASDPDNWSLKMFDANPENDPKMIFFSTLALFNDSELLDRAISQSPLVIKEYTSTFRVETIEMTADAVDGVFKGLTLGNGSIIVQPVSKVTLNATRVEDGWYYPPGEEKLPSAYQVILYFDYVASQGLKPGMMMNVTVADLDIGISIVKSLGQVMPTFYRFLPQELMRHFKIPGSGNRPPRSSKDKSEEDREIAGGEDGNGE